MSELGGGEPTDAATVDARTNARVRRPLDLLAAFVASGIAAAVLLVAHGLPLGSRELTDDVEQWLTRELPRGLAYGFGSLVDLGSFALVVAVSVQLVRHAHRDAINAVVAAVFGAGLSLGLVLAWRADPSGGAATAMLRGTNATALVVTVGYVAFLTGTDLARRPRWTRWCVLGVLPLLAGELALDDLTLFAVAVAPLMGWAVGLAARWVLGAASVRPSLVVLVGWLGRHGVELHAVEPVRGRTDFVGVGVGGEQVEISLANRDTRGSGLVRRLWHAIRLRRAVTGAEALSSRAQLEREALASYVASAAGVVVPKVRLLAELPPETLVLVADRPEGATLSEATSPAELAEVFAALSTLHRAGVAHRDLRPGHVLVSGDGPGFTSITRAQVGAGEVIRRLDVAQLLTSSARLLGAPVAVKAFREGYGPENESQIAAVLQPIALASWGWSAMRGATGCLNEVRRELAGAGEEATPQRLERFRYRTVLSAIAITVAAFLLVGEIGRVDLLGALREMNPVWFAAAVAGSALTYYAAALNLAAFVPRRLSMLRGSLVQLSSAFVGVAMPPTVGHVAVNSRYLHRAGVDDSAIAAAIAVSQVVNVVTTIPLLVIIGVLTGSGVSRFNLVPGTNILIGLAALVVVLGALIVIPATRRLVATYVWPRIRSVGPRLVEAVAQPLRLAVGIGASLLLSVSYVFALLAALAALGAHPPILATAAVYLAANAVGSIAPTPGGLGAVEAVMTAGLTAIGIPAHDALPGVLVFRVATFWLPIPAGWAAFHFLQRSGTL